MINDHADQQTFRQWLVWQLKLSRWSSLRGETSDELAMRLGVQPDVLAEAIASRKHDIETKAKIPKRTKVEIRKVKLWVPHEIFDVWHQYCKILDLNSAVLFGSICHHYLINPVTTPAMLLKRWDYRRKRYKASISNRRYLSVRTPRGVRQALDYHADLLHISLGALLRGLVIDLLEGRTQRLRVMMASEMWGDPKRYLQPELFR